MISNTRYCKVTDTFFPIKKFYYDLVPKQHLEYIDKFKNEFTKVKNLPNIKLRVEGSRINFFTDSKQVYTQVINTLYPYVLEITEPADNELELLQANQKIIIVDKLPHNLYEYKVTFKRLDESIKVRLNKFISQQLNCIKVNNATQNYLSSTKVYMSGNPYVYLKDSNVLLMLKLISDGYIQNTNQYIKRSDINNVS